jgi:threonine aldolase
MNVIDLRSDTVTQPTPEMRQAMAEAPVGDDVYGEDPTVNELEALACRITGKKAALFVASGTMGNLTAILAHTERGDEVICGYRTHIYRREQGAMAVVAGVQARPLLEDPDGTLPLADIEAAIQRDDLHHPITRLICLENTHNMCGGQPLTPEYIRVVGELAERHGLKLHVDGARLFNAAIALNVPAEALAAPASSVSFCLSKGLCAPAGSLLCGDAQFIARARRARKLLGGGMRQIGILAAAGIVALTTMIERLENDHHLAHRLARSLNEIEGIIVDPDRVKTNIIYFDLADSVPLTAPTICAKLKAQQILIDQVGPRSFRAVTHYGITEAMIDYTVRALRECFR